MQEKKPDVSLFNSSICLLFLFSPRFKPPPSPSAQLHSLIFSLPSSVICSLCSRKTMAGKCLFLPMLCVLTFSFQLQAALPGTLELDYSHYSTSAFDVSDSLQRTLDVLSFDPTTFKPIQNQEEQKPLSELPPSSSFSLSLHPRSSLYKTPQKDYRELTLSRLDRDAARVKSIASKLELALNAINRTELKPAVVDTSLQPEDLQIPLTSGVNQGSGEYFSRIGVGTPARQYYMVVDTGSDDNWLQCQPCIDCYRQSDPIFEPSGSSTYRALSCSSPQCEALQVSACRAGTCAYQVSYGDGSFTVGEFSTETLSFGSSGSANNIAIGCGHDNEGLFVASAGIIGLGGGPLSLTSQLKAAFFSYCLVDRDSTKSSTLEFNKPSSAGDTVTAPLLRNPRIDTYRYVGLTGISVGGQQLPLPPSLFEVDETGRGGVILDSGTAVTRLNTQAYNSLRDAFRRMTQNLPRASGFAIFDTCYDLSSMESANVPTVEFHFGGDKTLRLPAKNYMVPVDSSGTNCLGFAPTEGSLSIIGNIQQQGTRVSYDLANSVVGFSPNKC